MTPIEMYKAEDGRVFSSEIECTYYEEFKMAIDPKTGKPKYPVAIGESLV